LNFQCLCSLTPGQFQNLSKDISKPVGAFETEPHPERAFDPGFLKQEILFGVRFLANRRAGEAVVELLSEALEV
jgi:hypothetical protein